MSLKNESATAELKVSRRQFMYQLSAVLGTGVACQLLDGSGFNHAMAYQAVEHSEKIAGAYLNQDQKLLLRTICDVVLPKTDTPSAAELDVHGFIVHQMQACYTTEQRKNLDDLLSLIDLQTKQSTQKPFVLLTPEQQIKILNNLEQAKLPFKQTDRDTFKSLKQLMVFGYFTTQVGATQALNYQAVPGGFKGSIKHSPTDKAWGSHSYY
ncbi:gluconate 2-dehydrogenase subunit 3 family protein [Algibacillus agarilyticus]|uniref:gluconate 2-dehydrogenase subunit 3 family protein n=1 Tax=Algibacillus agarilyticus TaxID=2234133 RepID=UPI001300AA0A|nr:gluconate 2-dehydrogenase subunit 3 family protein [Algibacillus agarilyticus]